MIALPVSRRHIVLTAVLLSGVGATLWMLVSDGNRPAYNEISVTRGDIEATAEATGVVQPRNRVEIRPPVPGRIEEVLVKEGQLVRRGQMLARISSNERAALLDAARAQGEDELMRWRDVYRATPVLAPLDGMVVHRTAEPGQTFYQTPGEQPLFVMSDHLVVRANVDETDIGQIRVGQAVRFALDAFPANTLAGSVQHVAFDARTVNNVTSYQVDVLPREIPSFVRSGMTTNVVFVLAVHKNVSLVPVESIQYEGAHAYVLVPGVGGAVAHVIQVGIKNKTHAEVLAGLEEGDVVLVPRLPRPSVDGASIPAALRWQ